MNHNSHPNLLVSLALRHWNFALEPMELRKVGGAEPKKLAVVYMWMTGVLVFCVWLQYFEKSGAAGALIWAALFGALYWTPALLCISISKRMTHPALFSMAAFLVLVGIGGLVRAGLGFLGEESAAMGNLIQFIFLGWGFFAHAHFLRKD